MGELLLVADQRRCIKDTFGDLIVSFDRAIPRYEAAEKVYEESKQALRDEMKRLHEGLSRLDKATSQEAQQKIKSKMVQIAENDIAQKFASFVETFVDLVLEYGE